MSDPYLGQVICTGFDYVTRGYAKCDGSPLPLLQNQALYSLIGTAFGGDGRTNFNLPDMRGRTFVGQGTIQATQNRYQVGQANGYETVTITADQTPGHLHQVTAASAAGTVPPSGAVMSSAGSLNGGATYPLYAGPTAAIVALSNGVSAIGGNTAHPNMQPFLAVPFAIAITGVYPVRT